MGRTPNSGSLDNMHVYIYDNSYSLEGMDDSSGIGDSGGGGETSTTAINGAAGLPTAINGGVSIPLSHPATPHLAIS